MPPGALDSAERKSRTEHQAERKSQNQRHRVKHYPRFTSFRWSTYSRINQERKTKCNAATEPFSFIRLRFQGQRYFYILIQSLLYSISRSLASLTHSLVNLLQPILPIILLKLPSYPQRVHQLLHSQCSRQCTRSATVGALTVQQSVHWNGTVSVFGKHNSKE